jgi:hypothetical protein
MLREKKLMEQEGDKEADRSYSVLVSPGLCLSVSLIGVFLSPLGWFSLPPVGMDTGSAEDVEEVWGATSSVDLERA